MATVSNKNSYMEKSKSWKLCCLACANSGVSSVQLSTTTTRGAQMNFPYK